MYIHPYMNACMHPYLYLPTYLPTYLLTHIHNPYTHLPTASVLPSIEPPHYFLGGVVIQTEGVAPHSSKHGQSDVQGCCRCYGSISGVPTSLQCICVNRTVKGKRGIQDILIYCISHFNLAAAKFVIFVCIYLAFLKLTVR